MITTRIPLATTFTAVSLVFLSACGSHSSTTNTSQVKASVNTTPSLDENEQINSTSENIQFANLDSARSYNLFLFGNLTQPSADTEGSIAVGGNATLANYSVGDALEGHPQRYGLVVGGDLDFQSGAVTHGRTIVGGKVRIGTTSFAGGVKQGRVPLDFAAARISLIAESKRLALLKPTAEPQFQDWNQERGELSLNGQNTKVNVFNIDAMTLVKTHTLQIAAPAHSYVLVNVRGPRALVKSMGMSVQGTVRNRVLFNFVDAKTIDISNISFEGSILAPYADISFTTGVLRGQLIANSLWGSGQINHNPIDGPLNPAPPTSPRPPVPPENPEVPYK